MGRVKLFAALICAQVLLADRAGAEIPPKTATEPGIHPTLPWAAFQLVPSPELVHGADGAHLGLIWQVTPVLYSFGIHRRLSPWRFLIAEPLVRQSGSIELYASPEYIGHGSELGERFGLRAGLRSYFGLIHRGEYLSLSIGSAYLRAAGEDAVAYELGAYVLYGVLGVQLAAAPGHDLARYTATLRVRYF